MTAAASPISLAALRNISSTSSAKKPPRPADSAKELARVEKQIEKLEARIAALQADEEASASDYLRLMELGEKKQAAEAELDELYARWETLSDG